MRLLFFCVGVIILPIVLNFILMLPRFCNIVGDANSWLNFWPVYLSSVASFVMIYFTWQMLKLSQEQLKELHEQKEEENRARLEFNIIVYNKGFYLKIINLGKENAYNITIEVNDEFVSALPTKLAKDTFCELKNPFYISGGNSKHFFVGFCEDVIKAWKNKTIILNLHALYNDRYPVDRTFQMDHFVGKLQFEVLTEVEHSLDYIKEGLVKHDGHTMPVQQSLHILAKMAQQLYPSIVNKLNEVIVEDPQNEQIDCSVENGEA